MHALRRKTRTHGEFHSASSANRPFSPSDICSLFFFLLPCDLCLVRSTKRCAQELARATVVAQAGSAVKRDQHQTSPAAHVYTHLYPPSSRFCCPESWRALFISYHSPPICLGRFLQSALAIFSNPYPLLALKTCFALFRWIASAGIILHPNLP